MFRLKYCVIFAILLHQTIAHGPFVKQLNEEQVSRLASWTESDKQNIWELSGQTEGDMVLLPGQRNGLIETSYRWPNNEIPYELDPTFNEEEAAWIAKCLDEYVEKTCVTVRPRTSSDVHYVYVTGEDSGCWSYVGRLGGMQELNLQKSTPGSGCFRHGTIVHEFLHAAGFYHQQSATERDEYVDIMWENILAGKEHNFDKYPDTVITSFGEPYDYGSVMHYSAYAFTSNDEMTIVPKDPNAELGQRIEMSEIDVNKINKMYECP